MTYNHTSRAALAAFAIVSLLAPLATFAATSAVTSDQDLAVGTSTFRVMRGSMYDSLAVENGALKVTVPAGEVFEVRTIGSSVIIENDANQPTCNVLTDLSNQMILNGPVTATLRPGAYNCSTSSASTNTTPTFTFSTPAAGDTVKAGTMRQVFWSTSGRAVSSVRIRLSVDGGASYGTILANGVYNNGYLNWEVPAGTYSASDARLKIEALDSGRVIALGVSPSFKIDGVPAPVATPVPGQGTITAEPYDFDPATETMEAETIGVDRHLKIAPVAQLVCNPETRIKVKGMDAVYYCGRDGKRYVFPNKKTHDTWYSNFNGVVELEMADMQRIPLGGNVTYRPGTRLVKITTAPEVFAVAADGFLRHVTESQAITHYGPDWATKVDDIPDAFFSDYVIGEPLK